jgi:hypothetical protein
MNATSAGVKSNFAECLGVLPTDLPPEELGYTFFNLSGYPNYNILGMLMSRKKYTGHKNNWVRWVGGWGAPYGNGHGGWPSSNSI